MPKTAPLLPASSAEWDGLIAGFERDRDRAEAELERIGETRRGVALAALNGDPEAGRTVATLTGREGELHGALATLRDALADAGQRREVVAKAEAATARAKRQAEANGIGAELLAHSRDADAAFAALAIALRGRADAVARLAPYGVPGRRLAKPSYVSAAGAAAGLHGLLDLGWVSRQVSGTLAGTDEKLLASLLPAASAAAAPLPVGQEAGGPPLTEAELRDEDAAADAAEVARTLAYWCENPAEDDREIERRRSWLASKRAA